MTLTPNVDHIDTLLEPGESCLGAVTFGLSKSDIKSVKSTYPNAGFHKMLARRAGAWFVRHPLNPAPMMKSKILLS
ncbi:hypothetical protein NCG89_09965 [Spongiibacter taiwanensis]|uniref:hypothetical protein n=1 Tax=Spongiibacter taiwanensis TaxID=1748242 RepID=UPI00203644D4|nr:hypothetical protein [Spongiibacter taiwanensis]USA41843.1 hypothetical protein NCG89_09965 [Spongiibacter taiwanensis]